MHVLTGRTEKEVLWFQRRDALKAAAASAMVPSRHGAARSSHCAAAGKVIAAARTKPRQRANKRGRLRLVELQADALMVTLVKFVKR